MKYPQCIMAAAVLAAILCAGCPSDPELNVSPSVREVSAAAGATTFTVSNSGDGMMAWTPSVSEGEDWLSIEDANSNTLVVRFEGNATPDPRQGEITIEADGAVGSPLTVTVIQQGVSGQGDIDIVSDWGGYWWYTGMEGNVYIGWTFDTDGTWTTEIPSAGYEAGGTYVVDNSAYPYKLDIYVAYSNTAAYVIGTTLRGYYQIDGDTMYRSQLFETRLEWSPDVIDPNEATVFVAERL